MKKTNNFFIISNYKQDPRFLLEYCNDYLICDQSADEEIRKILKDTNYIETKHTGHNISDYFQFFIDNYDNLPEVMVLAKGNMYPRHVTKEYFDRVYDNRYYTFLYDGNPSIGTHDVKISFLASESEFLEINNSWYVPYHPHRYFNNYNDILNFIYKNPVIPEYNLFAPGSCYIVTRDQILRHKKEFYINLNKIISYTLEPKFPTEAFFIERMLHIIYTANYEVNEYMNSESDFDKLISELNPKDISIKPEETKEEKNKTKKFWRLF